MNRLQSNLSQEKRNFPTIYYIGNLLLYSTQSDFDLLFTYDSGFPNNNVLPQNSHIEIACLNKHPVYDKYIINNKNPKLNVMKLYLFIRFSLFIIMFSLNDDNQHFLYFFDFVDDLFETAFFFLFVDAKRFRIYMFKF